LIREFQPPKGTKTIVLFDARYLNPTVLKAVRQRRFHWISRAKDNRVFWEGEEKSNLNTLGRTRILITWDAEKPGREPVFLATDLMRVRRSWRFTCPELSGMAE